MTTNQELNITRKNMANDHVATFKKIYDISLDYSEASIAVIDKGISVFHPDGASIPESTYLTYASYVGEIIIRNIGGEWENTEDRGPSTQVYRDGKKAKAFPYAWVAKRFEEKTEGSLWDTYAELKAVFGLDAEDFSESSQLREEDSVENSSSMVEIEKGPAIVFIMVAAADGVIDKKEIGALQKIVKNTNTHDSKLFRAALTMLATDFESTIQSCSLPTLQNFAALTDVVGSVRQAFPDQADMYCAALYDLGESVARASGGFLGLGQKIGKEEAATLNLLKGLLGVQR